MALVVHEGEVVWHRPYQDKIKVRVGDGEYEADTKVLVGVPGGTSLPTGTPVVVMRLPNLNPILILP